jgi:ADP-heptose:LPS heptosyltransferase
VGVLVVTQTAPIRTILVVRLSSIGDIVLTTPVVTELRRTFPLARIDFCTSSPFVPLLSGNPALTSVCTPENLPSVAYDLVVDLQNSRRSRSLVRGIDARKVRRYMKQNWKKLLLVSFKLNLYGTGYLSVVERYREALEGIVPACSAPCALHPSIEDRDFASGMLDGEGIPVLAVCFGANHFTKRYPEERYASIIARVTQAMELQVVLIGGQEDAAAAGRIIAFLPAASRSMVRSTAGVATLMQSAALLERSDLVLTNDTGLMHIASSFGKRMLVLFGSSVKEFGFLPWGAPFELFETAGLDCRPCSHIGRDACPEGHFRCMGDLDAGRIAARVLELLNPGLS